jgi:hypothetical protein
MAILDRPIVLRCPHCSHDVARAVVCSLSIITVECVRCSHQWAAEITRLPNARQGQIPYVERRTKTRIGVFERAV